MSTLAVVVVALAIVGVVFIAREATSRDQTPQPQLIQCADGSVRTVCDAVLLPAPQSAAPPTSKSTEFLDTVDTESSELDSFEQDPAGPLSLYDGELIPIPGTQNLRVKQGDAAVIQAYQIDGNQRCEVAGVIGPANVSVTDGEAFYFANVDASERDLQDAMAEAAQAQQADPQAKCADSHIFVIR